MPTDQPIPSHAEWVTRFGLYLRVVGQQHPEWPMEKRWRVARKVTEKYLGPEPPGEGGFGAVVLAPFRAVKVAGKVLGFGLRLWALVDGKKTVIGAVLAGAASLITTVLPYLPAILGPFGLEAAPIVAVLGKALIYIGLAHKILKLFGEKKAVAAVPADPAGP